mgnify:CR=1 FL=1
MTDRRGPDDRIDRLMGAARRLPVEIEPDKDLWPGIEARITGSEAPAGGRSRWIVGGAIAAGLALIALTSTITIWLTEEPAQVIVRQAPTNAGIARVAGTATFGAAYALGPKYEMARQGLKRDLDAQMEALPPETREIVQKNLAQIRSAMDEINQELEADPNNVLLQRLLMTAYQDELTVLMNMNRMMQTLPTRTEI